VHLPPASPVLKPTDGLIGGEIKRERERERGRETEDFIRVNVYNVAWLFVGFVCLYFSRATGRECLRECLSNGPGEREKGRGTGERAREKERQTEEQESARERERDRESE